jgi:hypothetical protein
MAMDVKDWQDLASVFRAGAGQARGWVLNSAMQQHAGILDAQADRCDEIARERDGNQPVVHEHGHAHTGPDGQRLSHRHKHEHAAGEHGHDPAPAGHWHERDLFAPPLPLYPRETGPE